MYIYNAVGKNSTARKSIKLLLNTLRRLVSIVFLRNTINERR